MPDFVRQSLARLSVPGYKVFRWERHWETRGRPYRDPSTYPAASVATSGTHDNESMADWWDGLDAVERAAVLATPGLAERVAAIHDAGGVFSPVLRDAMLEVLMASGSDFVLLPIQDVFGWRDRINIPASQSDHNWTWRLPWTVDTLAAQPQAVERAALMRSWGARYRRG